MKTDLHKRLEDAANDFADKHGFRVPYDGSNNFYDEVDVKASKDGFLAGAGYGYKEAINECRDQILEQCKEWLCIHFRNIANTDCCTNREHPTNIESVVPRTMKEMLADFETDMKKLWEDEELERLANLCYYDFDMSEGEDNCKNCPRYYKCRDELTKLLKEEKK